MLYKGGLRYIYTYKLHKLLWPGRVGLEKLPDCDRGRCACRNAQACPPPCFYVVGEGLVAYRQALTESASDQIQMTKTPERGNTASAPLASCSCCGNPNKTRINNRIWNFRTPRSEHSSLNDVHSVGNQFRLVYICLLFLPLTALENGKWKSFHKQNSLGLREEIRIARPSGGCPAVWKRVSGQMIGTVVQG